MYPPIVKDTRRCMFVFKVKIQTLISFVVDASHLINAVFSEVCIIYIFHYVSEVTTRKPYDQNFN